MTKTELSGAPGKSMLLTEKQYGKIKARTCADGSKQREIIKNEDASSPTVTLDGIMITLEI